MEKEFPVTQMTNGRGHRHFLAITEPAIEDISLGSVVIIPYAEGFKEPSRVVLLVDELGKPQLANSSLAIVLKYLYD